MPMQIPTMCQCGGARLGDGIIQYPNIQYPPPPSSICALQCDFLFHIFAFNLLFFSCTILINRNAVSECMNELKYVFRSHAGQSAAFSIQNAEQHGRMEKVLFVVQRTMGF